MATHRRVIHGWNWDIRRWDGRWFHRANLESDEELAAAIGLWEAGPKLVAAVHPEASGEAYFELDPDYRDLEPEMLTWAEEHLAVPASPVDGSPARSLELWVSDEDEDRRSLLAARGYLPSDSGGWLRCAVIGSASIPSTPLAAPYRLRPTNPSDVDCARMADLLNAGFGRSTHTAVEISNFVRRSPSFDHELNLVAAAPDGSFAATVGATLDAVNGHGIVEPVCTHPDHRRQGLARVLLVEAMRRLQARGARSVSLDTGEEIAANALYQSCGFSEAHHFRPWRREFDAVHREG